jgi:hypothetical protein
MLTYYLIGSNLIIGFCAASWRHLFKWTAIASVGFVVIMLFSFGELDRAHDFSELSYVAIACVGIWVAMFIIGSILSSLVYGFRRLYSKPKPIRSREAEEGSTVGPLRL